MGNFVNLSQAIKNVLVPIQQSGAAAFADIETYPTITFTGTPAATITPSDNGSDYATTVQNLRTYVFYVDIYYPIETTTTGLADAFAQMLILVDTVLDAFDNSNTLAGNCQILSPAPSSWSVVESSMGVLLSARITLDCKLSVVTNNG